MNALKSVMDAARQIPYSNIGIILNEKYDSTYGIEDLRQRGMGASCLDGALLMRKGLSDIGIASTINYAEIVRESRPDNIMHSVVIGYIKNWGDTGIYEYDRAIMDFGFAMQEPLLIENGYSSSDFRFLLSQSGGVISVYDINAGKIEKIYGLIDAKIDGRGSFFNDSAFPMNSQTYIKWFESRDWNEESKIKIVGLRQDMKDNKIYKLKYAYEIRPILETEEGEQKLITSLDELAGFFGLDKQRIIEANEKVRRKLILD